MGVSFIFPTKLSAMTIPIAEGALGNHRFFPGVLQWALVHEMTLVPTEETSPLTCISGNAWSKSPWRWTVGVDLGKYGLMFDGILVEHQAGI